MNSFALPSRPWSGAPLSFIDAAGEPSGVAGDYLRQLRMVGAHLAAPADEAFNREIIVFHFIGTFEGLFKAHTSRRA